jgi:hypothetical protein
MGIMLFLMNNNITEPKFEQVCVWPFTLCPPEEASALEQFFTDKFGVRVRYIGENKVNDKQTDTLFYIASEDIPKFAVPRLGAGIRWLEDVMNNDETMMGYPVPNGVKRCW